MGHRASANASRHLRLACRSNRDHHVASGALGCLPGKHLTRAHACMQAMLGKMPAPWPHLGRAHARMRAMRGGQASSQERPLVAPGQDVLDLVADEHAAHVQLERLLGALLVVLVVEVVGGDLEEGGCWRNAT